MTVRKPALTPVQKLYQRQAIDLLMFAYVQGCTDLIQTISIEVAIDKFRKRYNLTEDELPTESALTTYQRIKKEYLQID